jgi:hypothetical protein
MTATPTMDEQQLQSEVDRLTEQLYGKLPTKIPTPKDPLTTLTTQQRSEVERLKKRVLTSVWYKQLLPNSDVEREMNDSVTYMRHLTHFGWNKPDVCYDKLKVMAEWRAKEKPNTWKFASTKHVGRQSPPLGSVYGFDREGRPNIYIHLKNLGLEENWDSKDNINLKYRLIVFFLERSIERMRQVHPNIYQFNFFIDCEGCPLSLSFAKEVKDLFLQLGEYYVERLHCSILVNTSWTLSLIWNMVSYFLPGHLVERYHLNNKPPSDEDVKKLIAKVLDPKANGGTLLHYYGGPVKDPYNAEKIILLEQYKQQLNQLKDSSTTA